MKKAIVAAAAVTALAVALTPLASGHATVSLLQPQGRALTSARVAYVVRAPNEKATQATIQVAMHVPAAVQTTISVKQTPDWAMVLKRRQTGEVDAEGNPRFAIEQVTWIARNGQADRAEVLRRVVVPDAEPYDPAAALLRDGSVVLEEDGHGKAEVVRWAVNRTARRPRLAWTSWRASDEAGATCGGHGGRRGDHPGGRRASVVLPFSSRPADLQLYTVIVPTETDSPTREVAVKVPEGIDFLLVKETPGWKVDVQRANDRIDVVRWTGSTPPDQFAEFRLIAPTRSSKASWCGGSRRHMRTGDRPLDRPARKRLSGLGHEAQRVRNARRRRHRAQRRRQFDRRDGDDGDGVPGGRAGRRGRERRHPRSDRRRRRARAEHARHRRARPHPTAEGCGLMTRALRNLCCLLLVAGVAATVAPAALADAGIPNYRSKLVAVAPATKGLTVRVVDGDDALELRNATGMNVMVPGYEGEPYLRFLAGGRVEVNVNSPAKYLNEERYGGVTVPKAASAKSRPRWQLVAQRGSYVWHEHRIHWMSTLEPPRVKESGGKTFMKIFDWKVPLKVGIDPVKVRGTLWWVPTAQLDRAEALIAAAAARQAQAGPPPRSRADSRRPRRHRPRRPPTRRSKKAAAPAATPDAGSSSPVLWVGRGRPGACPSRMAGRVRAAPTWDRRLPKERCGEPVRHRLASAPSARPAGARARLGRAGSFAHANLERTEPARGSTVEKQPPAVVFHFSEPVEMNFSAVHVYDATGEVVDDGRPSTPAASRRTCRSACSRTSPTERTRRRTGSSRPTATPSRVGSCSPSERREPRRRSRSQSSPARRTPGRETTTAFGVARAVQYGAIALAIGAFAFLLLPWLGGLRAVAGPGREWQETSEAFVSRAGVVFAVAVVAGVISGAAGIVLQGQTASGGSLLDAMGWTVVRQVVETHFGSIWGARVLVWLAFGGTFPARVPAQGRCR